jgi:hypothetical protein
MNAARVTCRGRRTPPHLAGDVPGGIGGEEVDDPRDLLRLRQTALERVRQRGLGQVECPRC